MELFGLLGGLQRLGPALGLDEGGEEVLPAGKVVVFAGDGHPEARDGLVVIALGSEAHAHVVGHRFLGGIEQHGAST